MASASTLKVTFAQKDVTTNTVKFAETLDQADPLAQPLIGTLYIPKRTLRDMGWKPEQELTVTVA